MRPIHKGVWKFGHTPVCHSARDFSVSDKDQNIGKHGYIGNWILRKYRKYRKISVDILTKISVMEKLTKIL